MHRYVFLLFLLFLLTTFAFFLCSCGGTSATSNVSSNAKRYDLRGKVVSVDKRAKRATIDHEEIPGFMEAMTMDFPIREDWVWNELQPGAEIRADLLVDNSAKDPYWLENIGIIGGADPNQPAPPADEEAALIGKAVPDFTLTNQDGKRISMKDFRGKALAITFIYSRCPLADYCIKMSTNFSDATNQIKNDPTLKDKAALLSISFDPAHDTPAKLKSYGLGYMGTGATDLGVWQLAVGTDEEVHKIADFFGLEYEVDKNDKTQINHSLRTAVIAPDGTVQKVFAGNRWTTAGLLAELQKAVDNHPK
jgi:protein SCO1/2